MPKPPNPFSFSYRTGPGFSWGGMLTEGDPSANPPNRLRLAVNVRLKGGAAEDRVGLSAFNSVAFGSASACLTGMWDYQLGSPVRLWIIGDGCPGISSSVGFYLGHLDPEQDPEFQRAIYYSGVVTSLVMGRYGDDIYVGTDSELRKIQVISQPYGTENITIAGSSQDIPLYTFVGFTIRWLKQFDGKLFIGLDSGAPGTSKICTFDGVTIADDLTGINSSTCAAVYHEPGGGDALYVGFQGATNNVRYRKVGDSPGTWTTVAPGAGTLDALEMAVAGDYLFIASGNGAVWRYDGTTLALHHTPAGATAVRTVESVLNVLYFGYDTAGASRIGSYDLTTYVDTQKDLTAQIAGVNALKTLRWYRGFFYAGASRAGLGRLYVSPAPAGTLVGTWAEITPNAVNNGALDYLMVA